MESHYVIESVRLKYPPEELLAYDYSRHKTLKCIKRLSKECPFPSSKSWEAKLNNQILVIRDVRKDTTQYLQDYFREGVELETSDLKNIFRKSQEIDAASPNDHHMLDRLCLVVIESSKDTNGQACLSKDDERLLQKLCGTFTKKDLRMMRYLTTCSSNAERTKLENCIKGTLKLKEQEAITVHTISDNLEEVRDYLHKLLASIIDKVEEEIKEIKVDLSNRLSKDEATTAGSNPDSLVIETMQSISTAFADLKRTLGTRQPYTVGNDLLQVFDRMEEYGYAGHVILHQKLTIYFRKGTNQSDIDRLEKIASKSFDTVNCCIVENRNQTKEFTSLGPGQRAKNEQKRSGRIGAFAKLDNAGNVAALSVPHFAKCGDNVIVNEEIIGQSIWPSVEDDNCVVNEISVISVHEKRKHDCIFQHDNMDCEKREMTLHPTTPPTFSKVFRGRMDTGFMTGRIITTEAYLPLGNAQMRSFLVEGDDEIPFAFEGDSGSVVKLQKEQNWKLSGVSMVYGGADTLPNIEKDTCLTIPLYSAVNSFVTKTGRRLFFH